MINLLTGIFLVGLIVASLQDLKRREVDNWLNLTIALVSISYVLFTDINLLPQLGFSLIIMFVLAHTFYYGRIFAGGDAKLLFAMSALFVGTSFTSTLTHIGLFVLLLLLAGSVYGLGWSFMLYAKNYKAVNKKIFGDTRRIWYKYAVFTGLLLLLLAYTNRLLLLPALIILFFPLLFVFAKGLEHVAMMKKISPKDLRPGDWLAQDLKIGKRNIKADWEGLNNKDIAFIQKHAPKKMIGIKEGIPFVPAFFLAFILYVYAQEFVKVIIQSLV